MFRPALLGLALTSALAVAEPIQDNSFLVEEAYNQEPGVVQFINVFQKEQKGKDWNYTFINEIPLGDETNQISYEIPIVHSSDADETKISDMKLNYRREFVRNDKLVTTGRLSAIAPTGDKDKGYGTGAVGYEMSLIGSFIITDKWVQHWNVGYGFTPQAQNTAGDKADNNNFFWAMSNVYLLSDNFNFMLELTGGLESETTGEKTATFSHEFLVSPSIRYAVDIGDWQLVPGLAFTMSVGDSDGQAHSVLAYLSIEGKIF